MGAAPIIGAAAGAVGTVANISAQRSQAAAQRRQIEASRLAAQQSYELNRRQFDYARSTSAQMYLRERAILDAQAQQARTEFDMQQVQQQQENIAQQQAQMSQNAQLNSAMQNLLGQASAVRGNAALQNAQTFGTLGAAAQANDVRSQAVSLSSRGQEIAPMLEMLGQASLLDTVAQLQTAIESANTVDRVANAQAGSLESNAQQLSGYRDLINQFYNRQQQIQGGYQNAVRRLMPSILDLQAQRNQVGLEAERFAREAQANIGQQAASINLLNQNRTANAQLSSIQSPNIFSAIGQLAQNVAAPIGTYIAQQNSQQQQPQFSSAFQFTPVNNYNQFNNPVAPFRQPSPANGVTFPTRLDVPPTPQEIPVYG